MWQYIKNIIPRIQQFSGKLDHVESFVDKPWVLIDEDENTHEYVFLRDHRLILSVNGKAIQGNWELLPTGKLLINRITDQVLLEHAYIDEGILLLKISGGKDLPFMLINEKVITDRDPVKYLQSVEAKKLNYVFYTTEEGITLNDTNSSTGKLEIGATITYDNGNKVNGKLCPVAEPDKFYSLLDGVIQEVYFITDYKTSYNITARIKKERRAFIQPEDEILNFQDLPSTVHRRVFEEYPLVITDERGIITKVKTQDDLNIRFMMWCLFILTLMGLIALAVSNYIQN